LVSDFKLRGIFLSPFFLLKPVVVWDFTEGASPRGRRAKLQEMATRYRIGKRYTASEDLSL
jgi:hypothetical protein